MNLVDLDATGRRAGLRERRGAGSRAAAGGSAAVELVGLVPAAGSSGARLRPGAGSTRAGAGAGRYGRAPWARRRPARRWTGEPGLTPCASGRGEAAPRQRPLAPQAPTLALGQSTPDPELLAVTSAYSRQSIRTSQLPQTHFASLVEAPRSGKNRSGSTPRQLARSCQR